MADALGQPGSTPVVDQRARYLEQLAQLYQQLGLQAPVNDPAYTRAAGINPGPTQAEQIPGIQRQANESMYFDINGLGGIPPSPKPLQTAVAEGRIPPKPGDSNFSSQPSGLLHMLEVFKALDPNAFNTLYRGR